MDNKGRQVSQSRGIDVSVATVGRLMAELGIEGACGRAKTITTRPDRHARKSVDLVKRKFIIDDTDRLWVTDIERHEAP